jgi:hypothetical protein
MTKDRANAIYFLFLSGVALIAFALNGCATQSKSMALGGAVGMGTGAAIGGIADAGENGQYRTRNVIIGSALGGVAGLITGAAVHGSVEDQKNEAFEKGKKEGKPATLGERPQLTEPKVEAYWIEGKVSGNRYVEPHWEYQIIEPARWEKN